MVSEMPKLDRRMYGHRPDEPEIVQENDVDGSFVDAPVGIPSDLLALIHEPRSVDPEPPKQVTTEETDRLTEENPNSRFRVLNVAIKKPGTCFVCKSDGGDERQFVDFGKTVDWYGVVYICTFCVSEVAKMLGLGSVEALESKIKEQAGIIEHYESEYDLVVEQRNAARILLRNCRCSDGDSSDSVTYPVQVDVESDPEPEQDSTDADEPGDVQEPGDVSESSVDDDGVTREFPVEEKPKRTRRASSSSG